MPPPREKRHRVCAKEVEEAGEGDQRSDLIKCAHIILPWLTPPELACVSCSCKTLRRLSESIAAARAADASRSLEAFPIPFVNPTPDRRPYAYFLYTPSSIISSSTSHLTAHRQRWGSPGSAASRSDLGRFIVDSGWSEGLGGDANGCDCERCDSGAEDEASACPCSGEEWAEMRRECGPGCNCVRECGNRVTQMGVSVKLRIVRDLRKGWGLQAGQLIRCGQFICEYAGEVVTTAEARRRQKNYDGEACAAGGGSSALLVVREHLPSRRACLRLNIDATRVGNVGRFMNHRCDGGNVWSRLVRSAGTVLPRLCLFAARDIPENEELTFSYGQDCIEPDGRSCFCGAPGCFGFLPSEHT